MPMDLKTARESRRLTQVELATLSGVDQATISRLERGEITNPLLDTVRKLQRALRRKLVFGEDIQVAS